MKKLTAAERELFRRASYFCLSPTTEFVDPTGTEFWEATSCATPHCHWTITAGFTREPPLDIKDFKTLEEALEVAVRMDLFGHRRRPLWYLTIEARVDITESVAGMDDDLETNELVTASALLKKLACAPQP